MTTTSRRRAPWTADARSRWWCGPAATAQERTWIAASLSVSSALVASSSSRIRGLRKQRARQSDALALAARQPLAARPDPRRVPVRQRGDERGGRRGLGGGGDLRVASRPAGPCGCSPLQCRQTTALPARHRRSHRAGWPASPAARPRRRSARHPRVASCRRGISASAVDLPAPDGPTSATVVPGCRGEAEAREADAAIRVDEMHVVEHDAAAAGRQRLRRPAHRRCAARSSTTREHARQSGQAFLQRGVQRAERAQRPRRRSAARRRNR